MIACADINLKINEEITGSHGLIDGGGVHDDHNYKIIGKLKPTGSVLDRLLLTSVNSVLEINSASPNCKDFPFLGSCKTVFP